MVATFRIRKYKMMIGEKSNIRLPSLYSLPYRIYIFRICMYKGLAVVITLNLITFRDIHIKTRLALKKCYRTFNQIGVHLGGRGIRCQFCDSFNSKILLYKDLNPNVPLNP